MLSFGLIARVARMSNGSLAVLDVLSRTVRVFDAEGHFIRVIGRQGSGPGEFNLPDRMGILAGDQLVVHDAVDFTQHVFSAEGDLIRTVADPTIPEWGGRLFSVPLLWRKDGSFFVSKYPQSSDYPDTRGVAFSEFRLVDASGQNPTYVGHFPTAEGERQPSVSGYQVSGETVFGPRGSYGTDGVGLWHGFPDSYEFRYYDADGALRRIVRRSWRPSPVPPSLVDSYRAHRMDRAREEESQLSSAGRSRLHAELEAMVFADQLPAFLRLRVGSDGSMWVRAYPTPEEVDLDDVTRQGFAGPPDWTVFSPEGRWLGTVTLAEGFAIHEIHPDIVLGVWRDELDVPFVRVYQILKK